MKIDVFIPCCIDQFAPKTGFNLIKILNSFEVDVQYNSEQTCCGETFFRNGNFEEAKKLGIQFMDNFASSDYIVSASSSCVSFVRNYFEELYHNSSCHNRCKEYISKTYDIADFLVNILQKTQFNVLLEKKAVLIENRGIRSLYNQQKELKILLSNIEGLELIDLPGLETLPGSEILFSNNFEPIATHIVQSFIGAMQAANADTVISNDYLSLLNIESYCKKQNLPINCFHIVDILANGIQ